MTHTSTHTSMTHPSFSPSAFIELALACGVLKFGTFTLKSGRVSPYFFNAGLLNNGEALSLLASGFASNLVDRLNPETDMIFGAAYKGIPFVAATAQALWFEHKLSIPWGFNRKEAKQHGEGGQMVGHPVAGKSVWVLDDVITAGTAMREVIGLLEAAGASIAGIVIALDRKERGQSALSAIDEFRAQGYAVEALVSMDDLIHHLTHNQQKDALEAMLTYREQYGV